jgi:hypothetical protein
MTIELDKSRVSNSIQASRISTQRALASLTGASIPDLDLEVCIERALVAHQELSEALAQLESGLPANLFRRHLPLPICKMPLGAVAKSSDCPARVGRLLRDLKDISEGRDVYGYELITPLIRGTGPLRLLADLERFSCADFLKMPKIGDVTAAKLVKFLSDNGVNLKTTKTAC